MKKRPVVILLSIGLFLGGCAPKVQTIGFPKNPTAATNPYAVVVLDKTTAFIGFSTQERLGEIHIGRKLLPGNFSYRSLLRLARFETAKLGGNALQVTEYREPDWKSPRHELRAVAYILADPTPFEQEIIWTTDRKLRWADFKAAPIQNGTPDSSLFRLETAATTFSRLEVIPTGNLGKGGALEVEVLAKFSCRRSWVRESARDDYTLNHEQRHFDIAELFARKIRKEWSAKPFNQNNYATTGIAYLEEMNRNMTQFQELYDRETGGGIYQEAQTAWNRRIDRDLEELEAYGL